MITSNFIKYLREDFLKEEDYGKHYRDGEDAGDEMASNLVYKENMRSELHRLKKQGHIEDNPHPKGSKKHQAWHKGYLDALEHRHDEV